MGIEQIYIAAGLALVGLIAMIAGTVSHKRKKAERKKGTRKAGSADTGLRLGRFLVANLQGLGARENQQDAFGISPMKNGTFENSPIKENAFAMILADGMGGLADGARIANEIVSQLLDYFNASDVPPVLDAWLLEVQSLSARIFETYREAGGATLVLAQIEGDQLQFLSIGDSDLFLWREGLLYTLSQRHEYVNDLLLEALESGTDVDKAFADPQSGALSAYIGLLEPKADYTKRPFTLQTGDVLMLCSDGVSDTLSLTQIRDALSLGAAGAAKRIETDIADANAPRQDNFTAILAQYIF